MKAYIYRCSRKPDTYIYLAEEDNISTVPNDIIKSLGIIEFALELDITKDMKLAKEDPQTILDNLDEHGFHIQLATDTSVESIMADIARRKLM